MKGPQLLKRAKGGSSEAEESTDGLSAELLLRDHFAGKRNGMRFRQILDIRVEGNGGTFLARTVDLSRTGILLKLEDRGFATPEQESDLKLYSDLVLGHFGPRMLISFGSDALRRRASVVRVAWRNHRGKKTILVGCRFHRPLTAQTCVLLGVHPLRNDKSRK